VRKTQLDAKVKTLEIKMRRVEEAIRKIAKELELSDLISVKAEPMKYAHDEIDKKIITLLLQKKVMTSTQIAREIQSDRHTVGKRLLRIYKESNNAGEKWLEFNPAQKNGHYRAWWVLS